MTKPIGAIVLAAGFSSRFGSSKLLAQLSNGNTVFQQTLEPISEVFSERLVVTRPEISSELQEFTEGTPVVDFGDAEQGMGSTLAYAVQHITGWNACVVCLADMPFIAASTYRRIAEQAAHNTIITPLFDSKPGNPVAFGRDFFAELGALSGDNGGRRLAKLHPLAVRELQVSDPGILQDIDTLEELQRYQGV